MAPDLNSLPPSRSMSSSPSQPRVSATTTIHRRDTPSPRTSSISLAAAATMNAADLSRRSSVSNNRGSPRASRATERRRSNAAMTLNLSDPTMPSPGELSSSDHRASIGHSFMAASPTTLNGMRTLSDGDPHHQRAPSLGELHQVLEQEQEAQVNRMLEMIRQQQLQLDTLRTTQADGHTSRHSGQNTAATAGLASHNTSAAVDDSTPASERSAFTQSSEAVAPSPMLGLPRPYSQRRRTSHSISSATQSPHLSHHPSESGEWPPSPMEQLRRNSLRDEGAYFQAETASLTRENQMLRSRIRELERQISVMNATQANTPVTPSNLVREESVEKL